MTDAVPDRGLRASDADRHATVLRLQDAVARGLLGLDEGGERMAAAWSATHLLDLTPLTADLPEPVGTRAPGWGPLAEMALAQLRVTARDAVTEGPAQRRALAALAVTAAGLFVALVVLSAVLGLLVGGPHVHGGGFGPR